MPAEGWPALLPHIHWEGADGLGKTPLRANSGLDAEAYGVCGTHPASHGRNQLWSHQGLVPTVPLKNVAR